MSNDRDQDEQLRAAALQAMPAIVLARQRLERELTAAKLELEEEKRVLEVLNRTGMLLASNLELETVVQAVTDAGTSVSGARFGAFFYTVTNEAGDVLSLYTLCGAPRSAFERFGQPRATPIFAPTFRGEGVIRSDDVMADPRYGQMAPHHGMPPGHLPVRSYLAVPVVLRSGEVVGGLFFGHEETGVFTERAERLVVGIAAQAAVAIDNARLYADARRAASSRESLLQQERASRQEAERVSLLKDEFLTTLSHELRTPLNAVLGWAQVLLPKAVDVPDMRKGLETIDRNARAQVQLIDDLLDMSRIISGKMRLDVQTVDLAVVVAAAIESSRPSADAKSILLRTAIDPNAGAVMGDPDRLQQIVWNLLSNAVKFTPRQGKIDVVVRRVGSSIEVVVRDSGVGISADFLPHVFQRFSQADSSITRRHGGLGVGLSIVKHLTELHGGTIRVESRQDEGATFTVSLPLRAIASSGAHPRTNGGSDPSLNVSLQGIRVLIVDDEADARELLKMALEDAGAEVFVGMTSDEALSIVARERPDVIVSDIGMPDKDGYAFMREVRALKASQGGRTPAIALTAFARSQDRTRAMIAGYQVHMAKPIESQELVATVRSLAPPRSAQT